MYEFSFLPFGKRAGRIGLRIIKRVVFNKQIKHNCFVMESLRTCGLIRHDDFKNIVYR